MSLKDLWKAVEKDDVDKVSDLLSSAILSVNEKNNKGLAPLHTAILNNSLEMVELLLSPPAADPADANLQDAKGWTPLVLAINSCAEGGKEFVAALLKGKADVNLADRDGLTPLHWASRLGHISVMEYLMTRAAKRDIVGSENQVTPLLLAVAEGQEAAVELLLSKNANPNLADVDGNTALHLAILEGHDSIIARLLDHPKINVNSVNTDGDSPLHLAYSENKSRLVELLVQKGAEEGVKNKEGQTPKDLLELAKKAEEEERQAAKMRQEEKQLRQRQKEEKEKDTEVSAWLEKLGMSQHSDAFFKRKLRTMEDLYDVTEETLKRMNVPPPDRKVLYPLIEEMSAKAKKEEIERKKKEKAQLEKSQSSAARETRMIAGVGLALLFLVLYFVLNALASNSKKKEPGII